MEIQVAMKQSIWICFNESYMVLSVNFTQHTSRFIYNSNFMSLKGKFLSQPSEKQNTNLLFPQTKIWLFLSWIMSLHLQQSTSKDRYSNINTLVIGWKRN